MHATVTKIKHPFHNESWTGDQENLVENKSAKEQKDCRLLGGNLSLGTGDLCCWDAENEMRSLPLCAVCCSPKPLESAPSPLGQGG